jgi:DNA-binding response OmpR family regulator
VRDLEETAVTGASRGPRVLLVEDQALVAMEFEAMLGEFGCTVLGPCATVAQALRVIETEPLDGAVLDITLVNEVSFPIADRLRSLQVPFCFVSGLSGAMLPPAFRQVPRLAKPVRPRDFAAQVERFRGPMMADAGPGTAVDGRVAEPAGP